MCVSTSHALMSLKPWGNPTGNPWGPPATRVGAMGDNTQLAAWHPWVQEGHWPPQGGGHSTAGPQCDGVLTTNLQRMVAPWAHAVGWVLSPGWILGAEGWVGSVGTLQQWPCHPFRRRPVASGRGFVCCFGRASHGDGTCASTIVPPCAAGDTVGAGEAVSQQGLQPPKLSLCHHGQALVVPATTAVPCHHHSFVPHCHHATLCLHHGHHSPHIPLALQPPCPHQNPAVP